MGVVEYSLLETLKVQLIYLFFLDWLIPQTVVYCSALSRYLDSGFLAPKRHLRNLVIERKERQKQNNKITGETLARSEKSKVSVLGESKLWAA